MRLSAHANELVEMEAGLSPGHAIVWRRFQEARKRHPNARYFTRGANGNYVPKRRRPVGASSVTSGPARQQAKLADRLIDIERTL